MTLAGDLSDSLFFFLTMGILCGVTIFFISDRFSLKNRVDIFVLQRNVLR